MFSSYFLIVVLLWIGRGEGVEIDFWMRMNCFQKYLRERVTKLD